MKLDQDMISSLRESLENIDKIKSEQGLVVLAAFYTYLLNATKNRLEAVRGGERLWAANIQIWNKKLGKVV